MELKREFKYGVIELREGDITEIKVDAIVNAANSSLMGGGGVDGAIHRAGGSAILEECKRIVKNKGRLPPGKAVSTTGGRLPASYVIHTVGPIWRGGKFNEHEVLRSCYRESLKIAEEMGLRTVAFPSISTGAYGYPVREAAEIAIQTVRDFLSDPHRNVRKVIFVLFDRLTYMAYEEALSNKL